MAGHGHRAMPQEVDGVEWKNDSNVVTNTLPRQIKQAPSLHISSERSFCLVRLFLITQQFPTELLRSKRWRKALCRFVVFVAALQTSLVSVFRFSKRQRWLSLFGASPVEKSLATSGKATLACFRLNTLKGKGGLIWSIGFSFGQAKRWNYFTSITEMLWTRWVWRDIAAEGCCFPTSTSSKSF